MSYGGVFAGLLEQYGQTVEVCRGEEAVGIACRAFVQPVLEKREQMVPTPLAVSYTHLTLPTIYSV